MKSRFLGFAFAVAALLGVAGYVVAQTITVPQVATISPQNDLIQIIPNGAPVVGNVYAPNALVTNVYGYYKSVPATNMVYTFTKNVTFAAFNPAGTLAALSVYLAPNPSDGAENCFLSSGTVTAGYVYANTGQSINNAATAFTANTRYCWLYGASNATWDRN